MNVDILALKTLKDQFNLFYNLLVEMRFIPDEFVYKQKN